MTPALRLRLDPTNPGHFFACCGLFELADRAWGGAEAWFEEGLFCAAPLTPTDGASAAELLRLLNAAPLTNEAMGPEPMARRAALEARKQKLSAEEKQEKERLDLLWAEAKHATLRLGDPFRLTLDWYSEERTSATIFKTWAGQQSVTDIAFGLKKAVLAATWKAPETTWLFEHHPCESLPFNFDGHLGALGSDLDVGFSFDPLKDIHVRIRPLVELLAFFGLQRFRCLRRDVTKGDTLFDYHLWSVPLPPEIAAAVGCGRVSLPGTTGFSFRLLYRTKYLKSFLPAIPAGEPR